MHACRSTLEDPTEGSPVTYEVEVAKDALFNTIDFAATGIGEPQTQVVINVPSLPLVRFWHVRARDLEGQESDWSETSTIRLILDDGINHGGGDCNISGGAAPGLAMPALLGALALAFGLLKKRR